MRKEKSAQIFLLWVGFVLLVSGCSTKIPRAAVRAYDSCDYPRAIEILQKKANKGDKDEVLYHLSILSAAMRSEDYDLGKKSAGAALDIMWSDSGKGRGQASLVSSEAIKIFKGEPFEKAMAAIYAGIIYYNEADYDNARAAFSRATLAIKTKASKAQEDFSLPYLLLAKTLLKLNERDNARIALKKAMDSRAGSRGITLKRLAKTNAFLLVEMGIAPAKVRTGPGKSLVRWQPYDYPEKSVELFVDGESLGLASEIGNLTYQARTKGKSGKDTIQAAKGVARDAATVTAVIAANEAAKRKNKTAGFVALGAGLFAIANQSQADVRQWEFLPDRIYGLPIRLEPGRRKVELRFFGRSRVPLSSLRQVWYYDVGETDDRLYLFSSHDCPTLDAS